MSRPCPLSAAVFVEVCCRCWDNSQYPLRCVPTLHSLLYELSPTQDAFWHLCFPHLQSWEDAVRVSARMSGCQ